MFIGDKNKKRRNFFQLLLFSILSQELYRRPCDVLKHCFRSPSVKIEGFKGLMESKANAIYVQNSFKQYTICTV